MAAVNPSILSDKEVALEEKYQKKLYIVFRFLLGIIVVSTIFSSIKTGLKVSTFLPLLFIPIALSVRKKYKKISAEINIRQNF